MNEIDNIQDILSMTPQEFAEVLYHSHEYWSTYNGARDAKRSAIKTVDLAIIVSTDETLIDHLLLTKYYLQKMEI